MEEDLIKEEFEIYKKQLDDLLFINMIPLKEIKHQQQNHFNFNFLLDTITTLNSFKDSSILKQHILCYFSLIEKDIVLNKIEKSIKDNSIIKYTKLFFFSKDIFVFLTSTFKNITNKIQIIEKNEEIETILQEIEIIQQIKYVYKSCIDFLNDILNLRKTIKYVKSRFDLNYHTLKYKNTINKLMRRMKNQTNNIRVYYTFIDVISTASMENSILFEDVINMFHDKEDVTFVYLLQLIETIINIENVTFSFIQKCSNLFYEFIENFINKNNKSFTMKQIDYNLIKNECILFYKELETVITIEKYAKNEKMKNDPLTNDFIIL